jgi:hypothetical protein
VSESADVPWSRLFNQPSFALRTFGSEVGYLAVDLLDESGSAWARTAGARLGDVFVSGYSASFGGIDFKSPRAPLGAIESAVEGILARLGDAAIREAVFRLPPASISYNEAAIQVTLLNHGFWVERTELNQALRLSQWADAEHYAGSLGSAARKSLRHLERYDLAFDEADKESDFRAGWRVLSENRALHERALSITGDYALGLWQLYGERVRMYLLRLDGNPIASALVYEVAPSADLVVAWGDAFHSMPRSPMIFLALSVVCASIARGARTLDLGTSNDPDTSAQGALRTSHGLAQFKRTVLAEIEPRFTMRGLLA